jgi:hypothetical protein
LHVISSALDIYLTPGILTVTVSTVRRTTIKGQTTTVTTAIQLMTKTGTIKETITNTDTKATTTTSKTESDFLNLKNSTIILVLVIIFGLVISIVWFARRLNCDSTQFRDRNHSITHSFNETPMSSPLEPSSQPFIRNYDELSETTDF